IGVLVSQLSRRSAREDMARSKG
ncbi:MAG: hypothetical protein QOD44_3922, partial [Solirubrobacteraceae bacterium]|nr:hypothetical protein [Solirubrobacteraceae bacterium]